MVWCVMCSVHARRSVWLGGRWTCQCVCQSVCVRVCVYVLLVRLCGSALDDNEDAGCTCDENGTAWQLILNGDVWCWLIVISPLDFKVDVI